MNLKRFFVISAFLLTFSVSLFAQEPQVNDALDAVSRGRGFFETLDLTRQQREAFRNLRQEVRARDSVIFINLDKLRGRLLDASSRAEVNLDEIQRIVYNISREHASLSMSMYYNIRKVKDILTPEQFGRFIEHSKSRNIRVFTPENEQSTQTP